MGFGNDPAPKAKQSRTRPVPVMPSPESMVKQKPYTPRAPIAAVGPFAGILTFLLVLLPTSTGYNDTPRSCKCSIFLSLPRICTVVASVALAQLATQHAEDCIFHVQVLG